MQNKTKTEVPYTDDGQVGIRASLKNMGFRDSEIGYDSPSGTVTLNGKALMKPGFMDEENGISYAKESDIQRSISDYYKGSRNPVVRVSDAFADYAGKYGIKADALGYGNGSVMIGGKPIDIMYIDNDGKAWARQSAVTNAADDYISDNAVLSPSDLANEYERRYLGAAESMIANLRNRPEFEYDPDTDPVFQSYKNKYMTESDRAVRDNMAAYSALTGGYANSAAATAGAQAAQYYSKKLTDSIPGLAQQAYDRYNDEYSNKLNLINSMIDMYDNAYKNAQNANSMQIDNINQSNYSNTERDNAAYKKNAELTKALWEELFNQQKYDKSARDSYWDEVFNTQNVTKNEYTNEGLMLNNEKTRLNNSRERTYQDYYERLLQAELSGAQLENALISAKINSGKY